MVYHVVLKERAKENKTRGRYYSNGQYDSFATRACFCVVFDLLSFTRVLFSVCSYYTVVTRNSSDVPLVMFARTAPIAPLNGRYARAHIRTAAV